MNERFPIDAISGITDPAEIRVVIFINNRFVHAPLTALVQHLQDQIDALEADVAALDARVTALETP